MTSLPKPRFLVIGSGFSGTVLARQLVEGMECFVEVWDERSHVAGNCHTERDAATGVMVHKYGPHIFNTDNEQVWKYVHRFGDFRPFVNRVKACTSRGMFSMPINLLTINQFFGKTMNPDEARNFIASLGDKTINEPKNFEEQALKMLGRELYETFFKGYTIKQWGCHPTDLPASVLKRLPIRFNYDDNYYEKKYQGIPAEGYTEVIRRILDHPNITVRLGEKFDVSSFHFSLSAFSYIFYTGPLDAFFGYSEGRLGYRTVTFEHVETDSSDYQGNAVINYPDLDTPFTRIHEHKHFTPWEKHDKTVAFREYSKETEPGDIPYYPKRLATDQALLKKYRSLGEGFSISPGGFPVSFLGRLATYRYMDMEAVINEAIVFSENVLQSFREKTAPPVFPNHER
ncbi:MAG: NAD(P)-binding protein [Chthoniobacterales bacterium]|nr:NAD(P)-binding protein [Chthoniobacterales bacterium]